MTTRPPNLADRPWHAAEPVRRVFALLSGGAIDSRVVGGAVRNALAGLPVTDIDFATTATPDEVVRRAAAAHIKTVPTGIEHGTVTLVVHGQPFEVTSLREDIATDGRRAVVRFGRDWLADARRRDFTVNALSVDGSGTVHDPLAGYADVLARRIRFIGDADTRIAEDRLRILRFFRFNAQYGVGPVDPEGLAAATRARDGLRDLSGERIGQEIRKLVVAPRAAEMAALMQDCGVLPVVLGGVGYVATLARLAEGETAIAVAPSFARRLTALACRIDEDALRLAERLRLSNVERAAVLAGLAAARRLTPPPPARAARTVLYRVGTEPFRDGAMLAAALAGAPPATSPWRELIALPDHWTPPVFPLSGRDVIGAGIQPGPWVGDLLREVETWWIERDFAPDEAALRRRLQQLMAQQQ